VPARDRLICALDTPSLERAVALAHDLAGAVGALKLGLEFFTAQGPAGVRRVAACGLPLFLDLKLHDIPNTVAGAVRAALELPVAMLTLHAQGGAAMLEAAAEARAAAGRPEVRLLAVTLLTSLDEADLARMGAPGRVEERVARLAELALRSGIDGLVCSPGEVAMLRARFGPKPLLVVPGIRPQPQADDQKRTATPEAVLAAGADRLVVGRPITRARDPRAAAEALLAVLEGGQKR